MDRFQDLMTRVRAGDGEAGRLLVSEYGDLLRRVARKRLNPALRRQVESSDLVQEAWLAFLRNPPREESFESPQQFGAFLAAIARNKAIDIVRRGLESQGYAVTRAVPLGDAVGTLVAHRETPSKSAIRRELREELIAGLGPAYKAIAVMILDGQEPVDVAERLGVSRRTVERIRKRMVKRLGEL